MIVIASNVSTAITTLTFAIFDRQLFDTLDPKIILRRRYLAFYMMPGGESVGRSPGDEIERLRYWDVVTYQHCLPDRIRVKWHRRLAGWSIVVGCIPRIVPISVHFRGAMVEKIPKTE